MVKEHAVESLPAIVLAAGLSSRMGDFKPLMKLGRVALIHRVMGSLRGSGVIGEIVVVVGHRGAEVAGAVEGMSGVKVVINEKYAEGEMLSSVVAGVGGLAEGLGGAAGFVLSFADQPEVLPETIKAIVRGFLGERARSSGANEGQAEVCTPNQVPLAVPVYRGKRGHPVVLSTALVPAIRAIPAGETLRSVVHQHLARALLIPVEDSSVLDDLDTPEDFARVEAKVMGRSGV